ncbi:MAG: hypothetical protein RQ729_11345, partial [Wenzhouxiangellaceae bacterium]|nr:hypothetical protein [Wenzhouxiangellaceae bacterium]
ALACGYLERDDYLRAVLLAWEALITHETAVAGRNPENYDDRKTTNEILKNDDALKKRYKVLRNLRNAIAHGERSGMKEVQQLLKSEERLRAYLQEFLDELAEHIRA